MVSQVQDMCVNQQYIYILDDYQGLSCYNKMSGEMVKYIRTVGHAAGEYVMPKAICAFGDEVYLLHERACNIYDIHLTFKRKISIDVSALDFIKVEDGFLFCNLAPSKEVKRLVYTDNNGRIKDSFLSSMVLIDYAGSSKCFFYDDESNVYFSEPTSDDLYGWNNHAVQLCYHTDISHSYDGNLSATSEKEAYAYNTKWFKLKDKVINSFSFLENRYYNIYDTLTAISVCGQVNIQEDIPFNPQRQFADTLYGVYHRHDTSRGVDNPVVTIFSL